MKILLDHHMKKQGILLWSIMENAGWLKLMDIPMLTFADIGMPIDAPDRKIWRFAQEHQLILLTGNRNGEGIDSLEQTIREENVSTSLPVLTIGVPDRMKESNYRIKCAERIVDIVLNLENYLGAGRIYIP
ncbi:MAG: DUF5615 family PIN-like protein [Chloroflexota bacterium]